MNKILALLISAMSLAGAVLIMSVPFLFSSPITNTVKITIASAATIFIILTVFAVIIRRKL